MNKPRRHFSGPEKVAILKRHLLEKTPVSDLCDEVGIAPNLFYRWQKEFFENGHAAFESDRKSKAVEDGDLGAPTALATAAEQRRGTRRTRVRYLYNHLSPARILSFTR
jgi:transposase